MAKPIKQEVLVRRLEKIGFEFIGGSKHLKYRYTHTNGVVVATVMVPKSRSELGIGLVEKIRGQTYLDRESFEGVLDCPFKLEHYRAFIDDSGRAN